MNGAPELGIVIPLYRQTYLEDLLTDLCNQTDKNFAVTIVSDGPLVEPSQVISSLFSQLGASVIEFENALGREDPSLSWARAVAEANQYWIWLLGDDDRVGPRCVEEFRFALKNVPPGVKLCRFPVGILSDGKIKRNKASKFRHGGVLAAERFLQKRLWGQDLSFASEYVFEYKSFLASGGFVHFPFAWCTDDATWLNLSYPKGIYQLGGPGTEVHWREGVGNTSSKQMEHPDLFSRAELMFVDWLVEKSPMRIYAKGRFVRIGILRWYTEKTSLKLGVSSQVFEKTLPLGLRLGLTKFEIRAVLAATVTGSGAARLIRKIRRLVP
jgi:hypothetical protein